MRAQHISNYHLIEVLTMINPPQYDNNDKQVGLLVKRMEQTKTNKTLGELNHLSLLFQIRVLIMVGWSPDPNQFYHWSLILIFVE